jgi:uncharacterized protein (UPF0548 family)
MAEWRMGRGWSEAELAGRLVALRDLHTNFPLGQEDLTPENGWSLYRSEAIVAREPPGEPVASGPFRQAAVAVANYQFSNPKIVVGHFDARSSLLGRRMLLEIVALRTLHYLTGVVVGAVRDERSDGRHTFGFRYDTLEGHIERGSEWFLLTKDHASGEVRFRIEAAWQPGDFPNWWSRLGFRLLAPAYQRRWHHQAHWRIFRAAQGGLSTVPPVGDLGVAHTGPAVTYRRTPARRTLRKPALKQEHTTSP